MPHTSGSTHELNGRQRRKFVRLAAVASLASVGLVSAAASSTKADGVPAHDHFQVLANGSVIQIGPHVCDHPDELHAAFHNFHSHVHTGEPTSTGGMTIQVVFC
jgi:hypothetical protein